MTLMNRRTALRGIASIPALGGATAAFACGGSEVPAGVCVAPDPLLAAIQNYRRALGAFNAATFNDETWEEQADALADVTWKPAYDVLIAWNQPATTMQGAAEAIRLLVDEFGDFSHLPITQPLLGAVLAYFDWKAAGSPAMSAEERFQYHLAGLKAAAEELDPTIRSWHADRAGSDDLRCRVLISASIGRRDA